MYDIIIVGAGPAGLTASIYGRRANKKVLVLEALSYGGQILNASDVENYPVESHISGFDFANKLYNQAKDNGAEIIFEKAIEVIDGDIKEVKTTKNTYKAKSIILATGAENRKLGLPLEDELVGKGISYCATCDGGFYKGKIVAVNGGGNTALEDTLYLSNIAKKVYLIHRRDTFRADDTLVKKVEKKDNVEILYNSIISKLNKKDGKLESIDIKTTSEESKLDIDGLFIAVGRVPENQNFAKLIDLDEKGYVIAGEDCHTKIPGIFVAGDNRVKLLRQLVTATSDGAISATESIKYINSKEKK